MPITPVFEQPSVNPRGRKGIDWQPTIDALAEKPGEWARVDGPWPIDKTGAASSRLKSLRSWAKKVDLEVEAVSAAKDGQRWVYARTVAKAAAAPTPAPKPSPVAAAQLARYDQVQRSVTLDTRTFNLSGKVRPGDNVYAFSREHDLYDLTAQVMWRGRPRPLVTVRAQAVETSVDSAMSVLVSTSGSDVVDITRWVAFEDRGQRLRLGSPRRRRGPAVAGGSLVSAGFGGSL